MRPLHTKAFISLRKLNLESFKEQLLEELSEECISKESVLKINPNLSQLLLEML